MLSERLPLVFIAPPLPFVYDALVAAVGVGEVGWSGGREVAKRWRWENGVRFISDVI